ncbi:uncharacterized protein AB675_1843 [Cyphellophora attinorum]|uniref:RNA polymerase I-specific transcription initiation factor rrn11 n=1 Tax=Cyphellophora attinorum TaxID=1664694 RepID=A0A0N0NPL3_9EURO|nr:uncharacterized protein AB675_1843 [Phialophora attinorum]KPI42679.1 hypothetical protein AB675_1843 [Phialophora attinorum]
MSSLYALPLPVSRQGISINHAKSDVRKRKRSPSATSKPLSEDTDDEDEHDSDTYSISQEARAVIDPDDRDQRRVAQYTLEKDLPPGPFPHRARQSKSKRRQQSRDSTDGNTAAQSLRVQHIAAMTAVLHRSVQRKDWVRAKRAFGLLLRTEISGQFIDIRAADIWGIGAEILFRQRPDPGKSYSLSGFDAAKSYYENLIIQYPYHRNFPNSVNSIDFYLAMFSLWIYVTQAERAVDHNEDGTPHDSLAQELQEAAQILSTLERITAQSPYSEHEGLKTLMADIKQWKTNLERDHKLYSPVADYSPDANLAAAADHLSLHPDFSDTLG